MFRSLCKRLWADDRGALIATETLFYSTILIIGIVVGLTGFRAAVVTEFTELGNAVLSLSQGFTISGLTTCCASVDGSQAIDTPGLLVPPVCTPPSFPVVIDVAPCQ
jgi:hypothetical protein